jgi:anaerobic selenocysteine-containing dehydrogenase
MARTHPITCPLCEACCGLLVTVDGGRVQHVEGDPLDPHSQGYLCPKGVALKDLQEDPDRLRQPMRRTSTGWESLSWEEALDAVTGRIRAIQAEHGDDSVAVYLGNPAVHNLGALLYGPELLRGLRTRQRYSATSVDQLPHMLVAHLVFGHQLLMPVPDIDRTDWMLILGANPSVSNGSLMTAPGMDRRLKAIVARGGRVELIDPRRTETARLVTRHHFIRPGTDALLLAAMVQVLFAEDRVEIGRLEPHVDGVPAIRDALAPFAPEAVAAHTGIAADTIRGLARDLASAKRAVVYGRFGVSTQGFGALCQWLILLLNLLTGRLDAPGGAMLSTPAVDPLGALKLAGRGGHGRWKTRVRGLPEANGELPVAALAEEIRTPGPGRVRALLTVAGNPVLSTPDGRALDAALDDLDLLVSVDPYLNETSRKAHFILPPVGILERPHYDLAFNLLAVRNRARWNDAVLQPAPGALDDGQILSRLHERLARSPRERLEVLARRRLGPARLVDLALRAGPYGAGLQAWRKGLTLARLREAEHGLDLGPLESVFPDRLATRDGRIHAAPDLLMADVARLETALKADPPAERSLLLIGRRQLRSNNSWMHNAARLMKGGDRCTLLVHPDDALAHGLADGDRARLATAVGEIEVPIEISDSMMRGVLSLPHGFGHNRKGSRLRVAQETPGASLNDLTDASVVDPVAGTAVLNGVPVTRLERAAPR